MGVESWEERRFSREELNLVSGFKHFFVFPYTGNVIIPLDFHIFQMGRYTTNQESVSECVRLLDPNRQGVFDGFGMIL